jgi:hypothetical protein
MNQQHQTSPRKVTEGEWQEYFRHNAASRIPIDWSKGVQIDLKFKAHLVASLQRFQVGESGEGNHIKSCAIATGDEGYSEAIHLFIAEENYHAQMLATVLQALDTRLLKGHWSDFAFILVRRRAGLELELMILMVAELIAKRYYLAVHDATSDETIRLMCLQILRDEESHVAFHCDSLGRSFADYSKLHRALLRWSWKRFYQMVCRIVGWDHREVLRAANVTKREWMAATNTVFEEAMQQIFSPVPQAICKQHLAVQKGTTP